MSKTKALRLGLVPWLQGTTWDELDRTARLVDELGYDHLWTTDHIFPTLGERDQPMLECWTVLSAYAAITSNVRLGTFVSANTMRNPSVLAKMAVTVDQISRGRLILGLGAAWIESEHVASGIDFGRSPGQRIDWLGESVAVMRSLFAGETVDHISQKYQFRDLKHTPGPYSGHLPVMIGGAGERKTIPLVARYADVWNLDGPVDELDHKNRVLKDRCADIGRDESEIERTHSAKIVIRDTAEEAYKVWQHQERHNLKTAQDADRNPWLGPPEDIARRVLEYSAIGFDTLIVELLAPFDDETITRLISEVRPIVEAG